MNHVMKTHRRFGDGQLATLVVLRWRMVRAPRVRSGLIALTAALPLLAVVAVAVGRQLPVDRAFGVALVTPSLFLSAAALAIIAPLAAGGGNQLYPADQLVAYPIRPQTVFSASLLLAPLNVVWLVQILALLTVTGLIAGGGPRLVLSVATTLAYLVVVTVTGEALAWWVVGVRHSRAGRRLVWGLGATLLVTALWVFTTGRTTEVLDASPTKWVVILVLMGQSGHVASWTAGFAGLVATGLVAGWCGARACAWALRRTGDAGTHPQIRPVRPRTPRRTAFAELTAVDRASVWRSVPLRRGIIVLGLLPGLVAGLAGVDWSTIVLLPALVAAGAGLLFGVNAFCLDSSGALWLSSLPHESRLAFFAKARVLAEVCIGAVLIAVLAAAVRAPQAPTLAELAAVAGSTVACTASVVATCLHLSIRHPHRAELRESRDTPAPPGSMAVYSARLAAMTTLTAVLISLASFAEPWPWVPLLVAVPLTCRALLALLRTAREWDDPHIRARVVMAVASG
jgi:hypothetical protein